VLTGTEAEVARRKGLVHAAIGDRGQALIDLVPALAALLGEQRPVSDLPPMQAQSLLLRLFSQLFAAFTAAGPLVLFLDDMQWSDEGSRQVLLHVLQHLDAHTPLLLIFASRPEGVEAGHPFHGMLAALEGHTPCTHAVLEPLRPDDVTALLAQSMGIPPGPEVAALGALVAAKSGGNPYFVRGLIRQLWTRHLVDFDTHAGAWRWDIEALRALNVADNVAEFTVQAMRDLPAECRAVLGAAACVGYKFEVELVARVCQKAPADVRSALRPAFDAGTLMNAEQGAGTFAETLQFTHDRVYQASVALLSADAAAAAHHRVAQALLATATATPHPERVFAIVDHQEASGARLDDAERAASLHYLVLTGHCARRAMNYGAAKRFFSAALERMRSVAGATDPQRFDVTLALARRVGGGIAPAWIISSTSPPSWGPRRRWRRSATSSVSSSG
jgi:predicted ATPase